MFRLTISLVQSFVCLAFILLDVVVCYPQPGDAGEEGPGKLGQRVEESIVHHLIYNFVCDIGNKEKGKVAQA